MLVSSMKNLALSIVLFFVAGAVNAETSTDGISLLLSTRVQNRYGGSIMLDAGKMRIQDIPSLFAHLEIQNDKSILPQSQQKIEIVVVVPRNAPLSYREKFLQEIHSAISSQYPNAQYKLVESFVDINADSEVLLAQQQAIDELQKNPKLKPVDQQILAAAENELTEGLKENQNLCESWFKKSCSRYYKYFNKAWKDLKHPYNTVIAARAVAATKFGISVSVTLSKYGISPYGALMSVLQGGLMAMTDFNYAGGLIALAQGGVAAAFGYNAKSWSEWCTSHQFPYFKESLPVKFYNRTGWFKSASINFVRSFGLSYVFRMLAYSSGQTVNGQAVETANTWEFVKDGLGVITIPEIILDGLMDDGLRALEQRGIINDPGRKYLLWAISMIDTVMHTGFRANDMNMAYSAAFASWGAKTSVWIAGKLLKQRTQRFVVLSNLLNDKKQGQEISVKNFLGYILGAGIPTALSNRINEEYTVLDRTLVEQDLGVDEVWQMNPSAKDLDRLRNDSTLSETEFREILNLKDTDSVIVNKMLEYRKNRLNTNYSVLDMCKAALTKEL